MKKIANKIIEEFLSYESKSRELLGHSFLSDGAKARYERLYLDRLGAVRYSYQT